jgi:hypothetical protein
MEPALVETELESIWNNLPEEIRSAYGQKYYDESKVWLN